MYVHALDSSILLSPSRLNTFLSSGFLPVVYSWVRAKQQSRPLRLPSDSEEEPATGAKVVVPQAQLDGWKVLLLWFPAACDLTATTVRRLYFFVTSARCTS